jgi:hypothetical protein
MISRCGYETLACLSAGRRAAALPRGKSGFSLLEVLVSCGLLVVGLAGLAAILPAAGSRLNDAASQDRAVSAVSIAFGEIESRNLLTSSLFQAAGAPLSSGSGALTIGPFLDGVLPQINQTAGATLAATASPWIQTKIDTTGDRGFFLEDEVQYDSSPAGSLLNSFSNGVRDFKRGISWGAMIVPLPWGTSAANLSSARVSVAVFQKPTTPIVITLTQTTGNMFRLSNPDNETTRKTYLKPCGYVLAIPVNATTAPRWLAINSSWQEGSGGAAMQMVAFRTAVDPALLNGRTLNVIGFEKLILVSERNLSVK